MSPESFLTSAERISRPLEQFYNALTAGQRTTFEIDYDRDPFIRLDNAFEGITDQEVARGVMRLINNYLAERSDLTLAQRHEDLLRISRFIDEKLPS